MSIMTTGFRELPHTVPDQIQTRSNVYFMLANITLIRNKTYWQLSTPIIPFQLLSFGVFLCCFGLFAWAAVRACPVFWRRINMAQLNDCAELKVSAELNAWLTLEMTQRCLSGDQLWFHTHTHTHTHTHSSAVNAAARVCVKSEIPNRLNAKANLLLHTTHWQ